ncbi:leucine-rich repeat domain-containing protein [uncultured Kordia sp.]|uniref:leucine-rich repeat domain-containing protein n=1 Tax=uncultured Kordia sp. TaxID=507699 RepID=UPI00261FB4AD|nr:leucine-rich repeat domain-containing protein [uncultured Kordia sp.]
MKLPKITLIFLFFLNMVCAQNIEAIYKKEYTDFTPAREMKLLENRVGVSFNSLQKIINHVDKLKEAADIELIQRRTFELAEMHYEEKAGLYLTWGTNGNCGREGAFFDDLTAKFDFTYLSVNCGCQPGRRPKIVEAYNSYATQYIAKKYGGNWSKRLEAAILKRKRIIFLDYTPEEIKKTTQVSYALKELIEYPKGIEKLENLEILSFNINHLSSLDPSICEFKKLKTLRLHSNKFKEFPVEIACLTTLEALSLDSNELQEVSNEIGGLQQLTRLNLSNNQITALPDDFVRLTNLRFFDMRGNELSSLPDNFEDLQSLRTLILWDNDFETIPKSLYKMQHLDELLIESGNDIPEEELQKLKEALPNVDIR